MPQPSEPPPAAPSPSPATISNRVALLGSAAQAVLFLAICGAVTLWTALDPFADVRPVLSDGFLGAAWGVGLAAVMALLVTSRLRWLATLRRESQRELLALRALSPWTMGAVAALAGWSEELLFRGVILPALVAPLGLTAGVTLSSFLFGLMHPASRLLIFQSSVFGLVFALLAISTQGLLAPIVAHAVYDFGVMYWGVRWLGRGGHPNSPTNG